MTNVEGAAWDMHMRADTAAGLWWDAWEAGHGTNPPAKYELAGARVEVTEGQPRVTAARVVMLGVFALAAKKSQVYLNFTLGDGTELVVARPGKFAMKARTFAASFNNAARAGASSPQ